MKQYKCGLIRKSTIKRREHRIQIKILCKEKMEIAEKQLKFFYIKFINIKVYIKVLILMKKILYWRIFRENRYI